MLDLAKISTYRENSRLEAKLATGGLPESIWETYAAFANTYGGIILLGVEELPDKSLRVQGLLDAQEMVEAFLSLLCTPGIVSENILKEGAVQVAEAGGCEIVVIEVPRASPAQRPVYLGRDPYTGSYYRSGDGDYRFPREAVDAMLASRKQA